MFLCPQLSMVLPSKWILTTGKPFCPQFREWNELPHEGVTMSFKACRQKQEDPRFKAKCTVWPCRGYFITSLCLNFITYKMESTAVHLYKVVRRTQREDLHEGFRMGPGTYELFHECYRLLFLLCLCYLPRMVKTESQGLNDWLPKCVMLISEEK